MKLVHCSDFHYFVPPDLKAALGKRLLGLSNLYLKGRKDHFRADVAERAMSQVARLRPDLLLLTGDLTALASPAEFERAFAALEPLLSACPSVVIPGNHDTYTAQAARERRIERYFSPWIFGTKQEELALAPSGSFPTLHLQDEVAVIGLDVCQFGLSAAGKLPAEQLARLETLLQAPEVTSRARVLLLHYPLLGRHGKTIQKPWRKVHGDKALLALLERFPVELVLHGHDHLRYVNPLTWADGGRTWLYNSGSIAFHRGYDYPITASFNVYHLEGHHLVGVEHWDDSPEGFRQVYVGPPPTVRMSAVSASDY